MHVYRFDGFYTKHTSSTLLLSDRHRELVCVYIYIHSTYDQRKPHTHIYICIHSRMTAYIIKYIEDYRCGGAAAGCRGTYEVFFTLLYRRL